MCFLSSKAGALFAVNREEKLHGRTGLMTAVCTKRLMRASHTGDGGREMIWRVDCSLVGVGRPSGLLVLLAPAQGLFDGAAVSRHTYQELVGWQQYHHKDREIAIGYHC